MQDKRNACVNTAHMQDAILRNIYVDAVCVQRTFIMLLYCIYLAYISYSHILLIFILHVFCLCGNEEEELERDITRE